MRLIKSLALIPLIMLLSFSMSLADETSGQATYSPENLTFTRNAGFDCVELNGAGVMTVVGSPALPFSQINVALPGGASVTGIRTLDVKYTEVDGTFDIMPATRPHRISNPAQGNPFVQDSAVYSANAPFPGKWIEGAGEWDLVGQQFATLNAYPVQYNPATGKLYLATSISYEVVYDVDPAFVRETYNFSDRVRAHYLKRLQQLAANPAAISIPAWNGQGSRALPPGDYEHVVITTTSFENSFSNLVEFYTKAGVPSTVITTTYIYANYSGTTNQLKIRNFVKDATSTWGSIYFLIGGDTNQVPYKSTYLGGDNIPNDTYYGDYDDDWKIEVYMGRAAVDSTSQIATFVSKTMNYMTVPPTGFGEEVFQMGFDLDSNTHTEDLMEYVVSNFLPSWSDYDREYDSESYAHKTDCRNYINGGHSVTNHSDHCNYNVLGVGSYRHGDHFYNSDASSFSNGGRAGVMYSLGCYTGAYDYNDCWAEEFVKNTGGGGVGIVGNSRYGWYSPGSTGSYSCRYDRKFFKVLWDLNFYRAGAALGESKNDYTPSDTTYKYIYTELNLFGDPAMPIWTRVPGTFTATYSTSINPGSQSYSVNVKSGGTNYAGAYVCLYKRNQVYERKTTDSSGNAVFSINPLDGGAMYVTATDQDMKPLLGECTVSGGSSPDLEMDLVLEKTSVQRTERFKYDLNITNNTPNSVNTYIWTNVTLPNGKTYPVSGYLDWPLSLTIGGYNTTTWNYSKRVPIKAPFGNYLINAFVGPHPGIEDEDHEPISVVP